MLLAVMSVEVFLEYLILREGGKGRRKSRGGRQRLRELLGFMCFKEAGWWTPRRARRHHRLSYSIGHMDAIHCSHSSLKQSISLNEWAQRAETHICSPLLYGMTAVWFLAQILPQDIELISHRDRRYVSTKHYSSSLQFLLSFKQHETCS